MTEIKAQVGDSRAEVIYVLDECNEIERIEIYGGRGTYSVCFPNRASIVAILNTLDNKYMEYLLALPEDVIIEVPIVVNQILDAEKSGRLITFERNGVAAVNEVFLDNFDGTAMQAISNAQDLLGNFERNLTDATGLNWRGITFTYSFPNGKSFIFKPVLSTP